MWTATLDLGDLGHLAKPRLEVAELEAKTEQGEFFWGPSLYCLHSEQGNYSLRRPPKLIIPQAVIRH